MREPFGLILAGGLGTRMGGVAKADLILNGTRLLDLCVARLEPQVDRLAVSTNAPFATDLPCVPDTLTGHLGPLAGVLAGLDWAASQGGTHIVTAAVDAPFFPCDLVPHLLIAGDGALTIAATPDGPHATFGLWPVTLGDALHSFVADGGRKVRAFTDDQNAKLAFFPATTPSPFFNINTPDDLTQAAQWI